MGPGAQVVAACAGFATLAALWAVAACTGHLTAARNLTYVVAGYLCTAGLTFLQQGAGGLAAVFLCAAALFPPWFRRGR